MHNTYTVDGQAIRVEFEKGTGPFTVILPDMRQVVIKKRVVGRRDRFEGNGKLFNTLSQAVERVVRDGSTN